MRRRSDLCALVVLVVVNVGGTLATAAVMDRAPLAGAATTATAPLDSAGADTLALRIRPVQTLGNSGGERAVLAEPSGIAVDAFGRVYVTDASQHRLVRFDARGTLLGEAGALGSSPGDLRGRGGFAWGRGA
jgi:hypothetical protein